MATGYIVHINGPFCCGEWPDRRIARSLLHHMLPAGEYYLGDAGYIDSTAPSVCRQDLSQAEKQIFDVLMARHETVNRRFKEWGVLGQTFCHAEELHKEIFQAIVVLVQLDIEAGNSTFIV